ncbi:hypothetical protein, partial [Streptococcus equi]|uniref:hypothetical protein n=1 Tax=Streptococcus equi TaxID=1336 RepID=UPI001969D1AC
RTPTIAHMREKDLMKNLFEIDDSSLSSPSLENERVAQVSRDPKMMSRTADAELADSQLNKTDRIANKVATAFAQAHTIEDFRDLLEKNGIRMDTSKTGETLFIQDFPNDQGTTLPWKVRGDTLKDTYKTDVTYDGLANRFTISDGSLDTKGDTADINQGIESHDGMDTNTSTFRIEREQSGTDIAPSLARTNNDKAAPYSLSSEAQSARTAYKQLAKERGIEDKVVDLSNKMNPQR